MHISFANDDDKDDEEVWMGETADSGSNGFITGSGNRRHRLMSTALQKSTLHLALV